MADAARAAGQAARAWARRYVMGGAAVEETSDQQFRILFERSPDLIVVVDADDHRILKLNRACEIAFDRPADTLVGRSVLGLCPARAVEEVRDLVARTRAQGASYALTSVARPDGSAFPVSAAATAFPWGRSLAVLLTLRDVSERVQAEQARSELEAALRDVAAEWRQTFDAIPMGILLVGAEGRVKRLNDAARALAGRASFSDVAGTPLAELGEGEPWPTAASAARAVGSEPAIFFRQVGDPSAGRTWNVGASPMARPDRGKPWVILTVQEATEVVALQDALRRSERMAEIGTLVSAVAHEVRNPLFAISAAIDTLEVQLGAAHGARGTMEILREAMARLVALMQDLLDYGRPSARERTSAWLESVAYDAIRECAPLVHAGRTEVVSRCAGGMPPLEMDRGRLVRAVQNVIQNAIQHSPAGGVVEVEVGLVKSDGRSWALCAVRDHGPGFAAGDISRVFEPLFTRRPGGTGLGLSIARKVVEEHGGHISADNHPGGGGYVSIRLPCGPRSRGQG